MENPFVKLFAIDFKDHLEVKKSGSTELKYVSWAYAWAEVKKLYPSASYEVKKFNGLRRKQCGVLQTAEYLYVFS